MTKDNFITIIDKDGQPHRRYKGDGNMLNTLKDGERLKVSLTDAQAVRDQHLTDAGQERLKQYDAWLRDGQFNRPGFRVINDHEAKDGRLAVAAARDAYERDLVNAWRTPRNDSDDPRTGFGSRRNHGEPVAETWKRPDQAVYGKPIEGDYRSALGSPCMTPDKRAGVVAMGADGNLYCRANADIEDPSLTGSEAATSDRAMRDREAAYQEYSARIQDAWKTLR